MSALTGTLEAGDVVIVTYYQPRPTLAESRDAGVYKTCAGVTLLHVYDDAEAGVTRFSFRDRCHPGQGGISYGDTSWADVQHAVANGALF